MKKAALKKSARRAVKSSAVRFISIALISFLGAGIFAGLAAVSPNMKRVGDDYYDEKNVMDARMLSTYGFTEEDVAAIRGTEGVIGVMASYSVDATGNVDNKDYAFRMNGLPQENNSEDKDYMNQLKLIEGKWPDNINEAIIIRPSIGLKNITLNSTVLLDSASNVKLSDMLSSTEFTITGIAESPYYLSFMQGNTSVGSGSIDYVLYVPKDSFQVDGYTDLYVTIEGAKEQNAFENKYFDEVAATVNRLENLATDRETLRYEEFQSELSDAKAEYEDKEKDVTGQLEDALSKLKEGEEALAEAREKYTDGLAEYNTQKTEAAGKLSEAKGKLDDAEKQISSGEQELVAKTKELEAASNQLKEVRISLDLGWKEYNTKNQEYLDNKQFLENNKDALDSAQYNTALAKLKDAEVELTIVKGQLVTGETEYQSKSTELTNARVLLQSSEGEIQSAKQSYQSGLSEYKEQSLIVEQKLATAKSELDQAKEKIADGEKELLDKQKEYEEKKAEADTKLEEARLEIEDAEKKLTDMGDPKWYVLDRNMNESFVVYKDDTLRMQDLATVFPVIFYLVAALVCLTTMTRMVDEDRTLIGTFKALGYSNGKIAGRYLRYAAAASLIGSIMGVAIGFWLLPTIIWNAYGIVFALPNMTPAFYYGIAGISIFATVFIITLSTGIAAKKSLLETPAELMRPKAPSIGKRVFLEYIKPLWSRLSFTKKVTARNLGLNKKRLIMTLIGIVGCTALVITAFGAKNAVRTLLDKQFDGIFHYDVSIGFDEEEPSVELTTRLNDKSYFEKSTEVLRKSAEASLTEDDKKTSNIYIVAAKDAKGFADYVTFTDPSSKETIEFLSNSVIITEKLSMNLNVGVGDTIVVKYLEDNKYHSVTITDITRNYAFNYVYLGNDAYESSFGNTPAYNQFYVITKDSHSNEEITDYISSASGIGVISFMDDLMGNIRTSINSVNNIIWILIIAAGLLAFVVLYNLTNINIGERQRELATLKVLGFYDKETYSYIFRETVILSIFGCFIGLLSGIILYRAVVSTVEPDMIFLTRDLTWQGYLGAAILTMFFTWLVNQCMKPQIKHIDMLESLKSVD